jgi:chromosome segregation ATPase
MWQVLALAWLGLFAVVAIFALQAFGYDFARLSGLYSALPANQRLATGAIAVMAISLIAATIVLAGRLSRQQQQLRLLRDRLKGTREDIVVAHALQNHFDAALQHLVDSDPDQAISSIQKRLADTEQLAVAQAGVTEATDLQDQLSAIRRRQKDLRETVGEVAEKRRAIEPLFAELRDRQRQLERSVAELETDDNKNGLAIRLKELDQDVSAILARLGVLHEQFATLNLFKEQLGKSQAELVPLRAPEGGINALIAELRGSRDQRRRSAWFARGGALQGEARDRAAGCAR